MSRDVMKLALARLQARTDTADLDAIAALNEALAEQPAPVQQGWKLVPDEPSIDMQEHESTRWLAKIVYARDRLLTAVAALGQMHCRPDPTHLMRDRAVIGLVGQARYARSNAQCLQCPYARRIFSKSQCDFGPRHDHFATDQVSRATRDVPRRVTTGA